MAKASVYHFYPERIAWIGLFVLSLGIFVCLPFVIMIYRVDSPLVISKGKKEKEIEQAPLFFSFGLENQGPVLPTPELQGEMTFSFDPPRPIGVEDGKRVLVRMKKSAESKRVILPCRLDLEFKGDKLSFAKGRSSFWMELSLTPNNQIEGKGYITTLDGEKVETGNFVVAGQDCPIQSSQEFAEGSPFRMLAEAKWWGKDLFIQERDGGERLEMGEILELKEGDWLVWKENKWQKQLEPERDLPIAHIQSVLGKTLILEGWDRDGHIRLSLNAAAGPPFRMKTEDLFSAIRVRSEKQISCMMEKQCIVLKTGDWVLKTGGRWKILRKKEEREAFLSGKLFGELFVFEQIAQKQGQKMIQGRLFNPGRTQVLAVEMAAQSARQATGSGKRKGRAQ